MPYVDPENLKYRSWDTLQHTSAPYTGVREEYDKYGSLISSVVYATGNNNVASEGGYGNGRDIPNFHWLTKRGVLLPHTPYINHQIRGECNGSYWQKHTNTDGSYRIDRVSSNFNRYNGWYITLAEMEALAPEHDYLAQAAAAKIATSGFDLLTFVAEFNEIPRMFKDIALKIKQRNWPTSWKKISKGHSSDWLMTRYGLRPLLYDLMDLDKVIREYKAKCLRTRYSDRVYGNIISDTRFNNITHTTYPYKYLYETKVDTVDVSAVGSVVADIRVNPFQVNPVITAWEKVPFSFVLDWLIGIGKSLAAMTFLAANTSYSASSGYCVKVHREFATSVAYIDSTYSGQESQHGWCERSMKVRVPHHVSHTPQIKLNLNGFKILDLVAMLVQRKG